MNEQEMKNEYEYYVQYMINTNRNSKYLWIVSYEEFKRTYPLHSCPRHIIMQLK